jgi:hypothetical protein
MGGRVPDQNWPDCFDTFCDLGNDCLNLARFSSYRIFNVSVSLQHSVNLLIDQIPGGAFEQVKVTMWDKTDLNRY